MKLVSVLILLFVCSINAQAFDSFSRVSGDPKVQNCYGLAMVGMDSVINSRLGVQPDHILHLAKHLQVSMEETYSIEMLNNIYDAYLWNDSPHAYAISVFYKCAQSNNAIHSVRFEK